MSKSVVILDGARTPMAEWEGGKNGAGKPGGALKSVSANDLGAAAAKEALKRSGVAPEDIDAAFFGNALQTSGDAIYGARHVELKAGVPLDRPALTVNRLCGSGIQSVISGAHSIGFGEASACLVGGMENMSQAPHVIWGARSGFKLACARRRSPGAGCAHACGADRPARRQCPACSRRQPSRPHSRPAVRTVRVRPGRAIQPVPQSFSFYAILLRNVAKPERASYDASLRNTSEALVPPNPKELESAVSIERFAALCGTRSIGVSTEGLSRLIVGGAIWSRMASRQKIASPAPAAPSRWPTIDLVDDMVILPAALPARRCTAPSSISSPSGVEVPCALT
jgi:hypothetical protein